MDQKNKIALITPVKNELENLEELISSIENQSIKIALWIIINDDSDDGSKEFLEKNVSTIKNVDQVRLYNLTSLDKNYALGSKYSQVISFGFKKFNAIRKKEKISFDYAGILDSDCFVEPDYYLKLIRRFQVLPKLGIASGVISYRVKNHLQYDHMPLRWVRGAVRIWKIECFDEAGYLVGNSADAISAALAWTKGWESQSFKEIKAESREMGIRIDFSYYGESTYTRYTPYYYILLKCILWAIKSGIRFSYTFYKGYNTARKEKKPRIKVDNKVKRYFKLVLWRNIIENVIVLKNYHILRKNKVVDS